MIEELEKALLDACNLVDQFIKTSNNSETLLRAMRLMVISIRDNIKESHRIEKQEPGTFTVQVMELINQGDYKSIFMNGTEGHEILHSKDSVHNEINKRGSYEFTKWFDVNKTFRILKNSAEHRDLCLFFELTLFDFKATELIENKARKEVGF